MRDTVSRIQAVIHLSQDSVEVVERKSSPAKAATKAGAGWLTDGAIRRSGVRTIGITGQRGVAFDGRTIRIQIRQHDKAIRISGFHPNVSRFHDEDFFLDERKIPDAGRMDNIIAHNDVTSFLQNSMRAVHIILCHCTDVNLYIVVFEKVGTIFIVVRGNCCQK